MEITDIFIAIFTLMAGIGVFLVACQMMSDNLESVSSRRLKQLFSKTGRNKWIGVGIGTVGTAAIQSSGAVTVMVIGFVNVGIMSLSQAATIIYGANIGTTVTAQLVALGMSGTGALSPTIFFAALAGVGAFIALFAKHDTLKHIGGIITGFGLLFVGLTMMADAMDGFAALDSVKQFLASIDNSLILVLIGALLTAGLPSGVNARRTAMIHLTFNVMGVVLFMLIALILWITTAGAWNFGRVFGQLFRGEPQLQLALFHTVFNVCTMLIALPLTNALVKLSCRIVKGDEKTSLEEEPHFYYLDRQMLSTPVVAVRQLKAEIENMAELAMENFNRAVDIITTMNYKEVDVFRQTEVELNYLNSELVGFTVQLLDKHLNRFDNQYLTTSIRSVCDLERIGDYAENIVEYADTLKQNGISFTGEAVDEIRHMESLIMSLYEEIMLAYHKLDMQALNRALEIEDNIDDFTEEMERHHIERLGRGECDPTTGAEYLSLAQNAERVADHLINVGNTIRALV